jgi:CHRD domain
MRNDHRRELTPRELHRQRRKEQIQRRRLVAILCLLGLIVLIIVFAVTCNSGGTPSTTTRSSDTTSTTLGAATYKADLSGGSAVPAVDTTATGTFSMTYDPLSEELSFVLNIKGLGSPSVANIYKGAEGDSGTPVYTLFAGPAESGDYSGILAQGIIDEASLTGALEGGGLGDLIQLVKDGDAYVSVGTTDNPIDAIRGQISLSADDTTSTENTSGSDTSDTTDTTGGTSSSSTTDTTG